MDYLYLPEPLPQREAKLLSEVQQGRVFIEWHTISLARGRLKVEVSEDAVKWIDGVRYAVSCQLAQQVADELDAILPTPLIVDAIWTLTHPSQRLGPHPQPITSSLAGNRRHHDALEKQLGPSPCGLVAGWKDWVLSAKCWGTGQPAVNYGWHAAQPGATQWRGIRLHPAATPGVAPVIQPVAAAHNVLHSDYSQLLRLVRRKARLDGREVDLGELLQSDDARWIAHDGPLPGDRHPAVPRVARASVSGPPTEPGKVERSETEPSMPAVDVPRRTRPGERGEDVREWQEFLLAMGEKLPRFGADGDHGGETEDASLSWERKQAAPAEDIYEDLAPGDVEPVPSLPPIAFKQARDFSKGRPYGEPNVVVIHTAECAEIDTAAENLQAWAARGANVSWHYAIDNNSITQSVHESDRSWTAGPLNDRGIHIELAGTAFQTAAQWDDEFSEAQQDLLVALLADICKRHGIPARKLTVEQLMMGETGICGHDDVSAACVKARREGFQRAPWWRTGRGWRTTNHGDPGKNFEWDEVIARTRSAVAS